MDAHNNNTMNLAPAIIMIFAICTIGAVGIMNPAPVTVDQQLYDSLLYQITIRDSAIAERDTIIAKYVDSVRRMKIIVGMPDSVAMNYETKKKYKFAADNASRYKHNNRKNHSVLQVGER